MDGEVIFTLTVRRNKSGRFVCDGQSNGNADLTLREIADYLHTCVAGAVYNARSMAKATAALGPGYAWFLEAIERVIDHAATETTTDDDVLSSEFRVDEAGQEDS